MHVLGRAFLAGFSLLIPESFSRVVTALVPSSDAAVMAAVMQLLFEQLCEPVEKLWAIERLL